MMMQTYTKKIQTFDYSKLSKVFPFLILLFPLSVVAGKSASDILISVSVAPFLLWSWKTHTWAWAKKPWMRVLFTLWGYMCIRSLFAPAPLDALKTALPYGRYFIFAALFSTLPLSRGIYKKALLFILTGAVLFICFETLTQWIHKESFFLGKPAHGSRLTGPFNKVFVGVYLSWLSFPLVAWGAGITHFKSPLNFILFLTISVISLISIYASGERTALAGTFLCYGLFLLFTRNLKALLLITLTFSSFLGISYFKNTLSTSLASKKEVRTEEVRTEEVSPSLKTTLKNLAKFIKTEITKKTTSSKGSYSTQGGYGPLFNDALRLFRTNFLFGIGPNQFSHLCQVNHDTPKMKSLRCDYRHPHNIWLNVLSSIGMVGFALFASFFFIIFRKIKNNWPFLKKDSLFIGLLCVVIYRFFPIAGGMSVFFNSNAHIIWFILGWLLCFLETPHNSLEEVPAKA